MLDKAPRTGLNGSTTGPLSGAKREELSGRRTRGTWNLLPRFVPRGSLERRLTLCPIAIGGVLTGIGACVLVATSDHLVDPLGYGLLLADVIIGTTAVAIYSLVRRPGNRMALILLVLAAAFVGVSLQGAASPLLHSVGVLFDPVIFTLAILNAVFAFPHGRLVSPLTSCWSPHPWWPCSAHFSPRFLFSPYVSGGAPLAHCNAACPAECADDRRPALHRGGARSGRRDNARRYRGGDHRGNRVSPRHRDAPATAPLLPVYVPALFLTVPFGIFHAAQAGFIDLSPDTVAKVGWGVTVGRGTLAYGFLLSIVLATMFAGHALKDAVANLGNTRHPAHLRSILAAALDDSSLDLAFRDPDTVVSSIRQVSHSIPITSATDAYRAPSSVSGETIAYIVHDASLTGDPELVHAAGQALLLPSRVVASKQSSARRSTSCATPVHALPPPATPSVARSSGSSRRRPANISSPWG